MPPSTALKMIEALETALATNAGVVSVSVDGTTVQYDRATAMEELRYWKREDAKATGRKPKLSSINLGGAW